MVVLILNGATVYGPFNSHAECDAWVKLVALDTKANIVNIVKMLKPTTV